MSFVPYNLRERLIHVDNLERKEYFWANYHSDYDMGEGWVPVSATLPIRTVNHVIDTKEKYVKFFLDDMKEIPNPRPDLDQIQDIFDFYRALDSRKEKVFEPDTWTIRPVTPGEIDPQKELKNG